MLRIQKCGRSDALRQNRVAEVEFPHFYIDFAKGRKPAAAGIADLLSAHTKRGSNPLKI